MMKNTELAKKIKELRTRKGLSQDELSIAAQLNLRTIQRIESGETEPRGDTLKRLAAVLNVTPDQLIDWTEEEDTTVLMFLNISALSFIVFPLLGVIIPFVLWVSKKDKIKKLNETGKKLLNFQITWCITFFTMNVLYFMAFMFKLKISSSFIPGLGGTESFILLIPILYGLNIIIIVFNAIRSYKNKTVIYQPAIPFLR
ncbi:helix-turn-helix domain-containing protein [Pedobacter hiemivivus]|uniref:Helix-turn-helix domain-containing protein n=1 Tax=Pedobacter hiemivivus TaxID=2530454 RepID=A0A4R0N710_9SPHI|nr:helix-turn-helix domain-containing protein [Pedobacter hiemivivus]TCC95053.1 helix-turn-helix domain-containing protein [Pedobacter hiemivivus]